jgi:uncharacterized membrane protein YhaH (DUF805 family)
MKIQEAVEICVTKKYADFEGVATRSEYWWFMLFVYVVDILLESVSRPLAGVFVLAMLVPQLAAGARRLHDTGRSAWWLLLWLVPVAGWIVLFIFQAQEGKSPTTPT